MLYPRIQDDSRPVCRGGWSQPALLPKHPARGGELGAAAVNTAKRPSQLSAIYELFRAKY